MLSVLSLGRLLHSLSPSAKLALSASEFRIAVHPSFERVGTIRFSELLKSFVYSTEWQTPATSSIRAI